MGGNFKITPLEIHSHEISIFGRHFWEIDSYPLRVLGTVVDLPKRMTNPAQHWIKILHPWVQEFYPVLGLGSGGRLLMHFQTPTPHWIHFIGRHFDSKTSQPWSLYSESVKCRFSKCRFSVLNLEFDFISDGGCTREKQIQKALGSLPPCGNRCRFSESAICSSRVRPPSEIKSNFKVKTLKWRPLRWRLTLSDILGMMQNYPA